MDTPKKKLIATRLPVGLHRKLALRAVREETTVQALIQEAVETLLKARYHASRKQTRKPGRKPGARNLFHT